MSNKTYDVIGHSEMLADRVRMEAYVQSLRAVCREDAVVLDLGTGTGVMALLAGKLGARRVYAVELSNAILVARELAQVNGLSDRITFLQAASTEIVLPEPVDIVVADVRGVLPVVGTSLATMIDARRFLSRSGVIIPARDTIRAALVEREEMFELRVGPWRRLDCGLDGSIVERLTLNTWTKDTTPAEALLTRPSDVLTIDYASCSEANVSGSFESEVMRGGTAHGLCVWFDTQLVDGIGFSNEPGRPQAIYGQAFFPLMRPVAVERGDIVNVRLQASQVADDYVWRWDVAIRSADNVGKVRLSQSTFFGLPLSMESLRSLDAAATPSRGIDAEIDRFILGCLDGRTTLARIAQTLWAQYPGSFHRADEALTRVRTVLGRYAE
ncbi:MAG: 50S ribosomal protein L11 methyltransferase [Vicinamibacterales bacterium]